MDTPALDQYLLGEFSEKYNNIYQDYQETLGSDIVRNFYYLECFNEVSSNVKQICDNENQAVQAAEKKFNEARRNMGKTTKGSKNSKTQTKNKLQELHKQHETQYNNLFAACNEIQIQKEAYEQLVKSIFLPNNFSQFYSNMVTLVESGALTKDEDFIIYLLVKLSCFEEENLKIAKLKPSKDAIWSRFIGITPQAKLTTAPVVSLPLLQHQGTLYAYFFRNYCHWALEQCFNKCDKIIGDLQKTKYTVINLMKNDQKAEKNLVFSINQILNQQ